MDKTNSKKILRSLESPLGNPPLNVWAYYGDPPIDRVDETGSTNEDLKAAARKGAGTRVLIAERQSAGKGRQGRSFFSEGGLYMSAILPPLSEAAPFVTHLAAIAVADAVCTLTSEHAEIKWVNDVYVRGKKICGILCESSMTEKGRVYIAGVGVNLREPQGGFPSEIAQTAGAIQCDKNALAGEILKRLFYQIAFFDKEKTIKRYSELCFLRGKTVTVVQNERERRAVVLGLSDELGLIVRYESGEEQTLRSGEVRLLLR